MCYLRLQGCDLAYGILLRVWQIWLPQYKHCMHKEVHDKFAKAVMVVQNDWQIYMHKNFLWVFFISCTCVTYHCMLIYHTDSCSFRSCYDLHMTSFTCMMESNDMFVKTTTVIQNNPHIYIMDSLLWLVFLYHDLHSGQPLMFFFSISWFT